MFVILKVLLAQFNCHFFFFSAKEIINIFFYLLILLFMLMFREIPTETSLK